MTINQCEFCHDRYPDGVQHICDLGIDEVEASWRDLRSSNMGWMVLCWLADAWIVIGRWWQLDTDGPFMMFGMRGPSFNPPRWDHIPWQKFKKIISTCGKRYLAQFDYITDERVEVGVGVSRNDLGAFSARINFKGLDDVPEMTINDIRLIEVK